ncbi:IPT/TIG domain-containing protein [Dysgonomonas sp. 511]|uniref:IPT/TIG domain-containing protein n=1 Tax=Dysgonomonas sp. 511 TaxID=2302930 RepID=UPI0013D3DB67|nr:IPT/TIG domain-containing protein [Dysgonomonas sp. 511]NDV77710.1 hypothetical protein [Dysgonomonas sp. 511]
MKNIYIVFKVLILALGLAFVSCDEDLVYDKETVNDPIVTDFSPKSGRVGTEITIIGEYLNKIDSAWIGGELAEVKYRISSNEVVVKVVAANKTGKILLSGSNGKIETPENFTLLYAVPSLSAYPTSGKVDSEIFVEGSDMDVVSAVYFGTAKAEIVSQTESDITVIVPFFQDAKVDIILEYNTIAGVKQTGTTGTPFELEWIVPVLTTYPVKAKVNDEITIEGENIDAILDVYFGTVKAEIISRAETSIVVKVPYFDEDKVDIIVDYYTAAGIKQTGTTGTPFELDRLSPVVTNAPASGTLLSAITLTGTELTLIDEVWFGSYKATIKQQTGNELTVLVPEDFDTTGDVELKAIYNGTKELVINPSFRVKALYYWENITIYAQSENTPNNFFNAKTGEIYTPCAYESVKDNIYFFITWSTDNATFQLNNPANSSSQTKNFKCNGSALPTETMPNVVKFRILSSSGKQLEYKNKVLNKELSELNQQMITNDGILAAGTSAPRYKQSKDGKNIYNIGDVLMFQLFDGTTPEKVGFIEIVSATDITSVTTESSLTFNCYFQK